MTEGLPPSTSIFNSIMRLVLRQMKHLAKASVVLNVVVIFFFFADFLFTRIWIPDDPNLPSDDKVGLVVRANGDAVQDTIKERCSGSKKILMFGMKKHWFQFCKYQGMEHISYLVDFPREISCPGLPCGVTVSYSEQATDIRNADIVTFSNVYNWLSPAMWDWAQGNRSEGQTWVMISLDSPLYVPGLKPPDSYNEKTYNMIASYKLDSDVYIPYGFYQKYDSPESGVNLEQLWTQKNQMVAWISSNCETFQWERLRFVNEFKAALPVDKYGSCGDTVIPWGDEKTVRDILSRYKFYLSFENSCCEDYVTEKFWRALDLGVVPIVVGATYEEYRRVAPPNSFIHVDQYESLAEMVAQVSAIGNDKSRYLEYVKWRINGKVVTHFLEEQYVTPLMNSTFCGILDRYLRTAPDDRKKVVNYNGPHWMGSCKDCGSKWIKSYMKH